MSKRIILVTVGSLALVTLGVGAAGAGALHHMGPCGMSREDHQAMVLDHVSQALDQVDATDDQVTRINALVEDAFPRFDALHDGMEAHHARAREVLTAPTLDRAAVEELRLEAVAGFDSASQIVATLVADVGDVLTVEQRQDLAEMADKMRTR